MQQHCGSVAEAQKLIDGVLNSPITPTVLDLHNSAGLTVVLGLDGARDEVEWQIARAADFGFTEPATLDYDKAFQQQPAVKKLSVLPSKLAEAISAIGKAPFVARAGNGVIYYSGNEISWSTAPIPKHLQQRVKDTFDPNHIFPEL